MSLKVLVIGYGSIGKRHADIPGLERNDTYRAQHRAILEDDSSLVCTFEEGLETMQLIDSIRSFNT